MNDFYAYAAGFPGMKLHKDIRSFLKVDIHMKADGTPYKRNCPQKFGDILRDTRTTVEFGRPRVHPFAITRTKGGMYYSFVCPYCGEIHSTERLWGSKVLLCTLYSNRKPVVDGIAGHDSVDFYPADIEDFTLSKWPEDNDSGKEQNDE